MFFYKELVMAAAKRPHSPVGHLRPSEASFRTARHPVADGRWERPAPLGPPAACVAGLVVGTTSSLVMLQAAACKKSAAAACVARPGRSRRVLLLPRRGASLPPPPLPHRLYRG